MRTSRLMMLTLVFLLACGSVGVLYSSEQKCNYCSHAHENTDGLPDCSEPEDFGSEKTAGTVSGNCHSGGTDSCDDEEGVATSWVTVWTYKCVRYPYRWEAQSSEEVEVNDCEQWTP